MKVNGKYLSPEEILAFEPKNLDEHMSERKKMFHNDVANESEILENVYPGEHGKRLVANPFCALTKNGERLRKQVADQSSNEWELSVPTELHEFYKLGNRKNETECYDGIFDSPVDFDEFDCYISEKKKNKPPAKSGIRIDHMCGLHEKGREDICRLISIPYVSDMTFSSWNWENNQLDS